MQSASECLCGSAPESDIAAQIRSSVATPRILEALRRTVPDLGPTPPTTYTLYRQFESSGVREGYEAVYFARRAQLSRAVLEMLLGDDSLRDVVHDILWTICEETTWVLPAHEEQGPSLWRPKSPVRTSRLGAHTALTREPNSIDLFAAETGASLAETLHFVGERLTPEVCQRVRQEVERRIFMPYLAYGRSHWWHRSGMNWNGVCNGAIGLAFMRLERDPATLGQALDQVLEGLEAYIATGFEGDGGSIEGVGYWNYGLLYYVTLAELLRERSDGRMDLLAAPRLRDIVQFPLAMALSPGRFAALGDATEEQALAPGIIQRLAERTGVDELRAMIAAPEKLGGAGHMGKLAIVLRNAAWWDGVVHPFPPTARQDAYLEGSAVIRLTGEAPGGRPLALVAKAGHTDGHHRHADVGSFVLHVDGESLLCDPGPGRYSREYFCQARYENLFCSSLGHSVPRIGGQLQSAGSEFGGCRHYAGRIVAHGQQSGSKYVTIEFQAAYELPELCSALRTLCLQPDTGEVTLEDSFTFTDAPLEVQEALMTWCTVDVEGPTARVIGRHSQLTMAVEEPAEAVFSAERLDDVCRANRKEGTLTRLTVALPTGTTRFRLRITPSPC